MKVSCFKQLNLEILELNFLLSNQYFDHSAYQHIRFGHKKWLIENSFKKNFI